MTSRFKRRWTTVSESLRNEVTERACQIEVRADEGSGPRLSLVPPERQMPPEPTDYLPGSEEGTEVVATPFDDVPLPDTRKRLAGWSAERQRQFLATLAETGSVHLAADVTALTARSAYKLRTRSPAFAAAWDTAQQLAVGRLSAIAFDRALNGRVEQLFEDGELVAERRVPNDRLLTWLLARLDPRRFALPWEQRGDADPQADALARFPAMLDAVTDTPDY